MSGPQPPEFPVDATVIGRLEKQIRKRKPLGEVQVGDVVWCGGFVMVRTPPFRSGSIRRVGLIYWRREGVDRGRFGGGYGEIPPSTEPWINPWSGRTEPPRPSPMRPVTWDEFMTCANWNHAFWQQRAFKDGRMDLVEVAP